MRGSRAALLGTVVAVLLVGGCTELVDSDEVEDAISERFELVFGTPPEKVECDRLERKEDATARCVITAPDGSELGATARVTDADGFITTYMVEFDGFPAP